MTHRTLCWTAAFCISVVAAVARADDAAGPQLRLIGTVRASDGGIALCLDPATARPFSLKVGQKFHGWELVAVRADDAIFAKHDPPARAVVTIASPANRGIFTPPPQSPVASQSASAKSPQPPQISAPPKGTWKDGDGQMINPPRK